MKAILFLMPILSVGILISSCDKVENPYPPQYPTELNKDLYPGDWNDYVDNEWPDFSTIPNTNTNRNALIEDFTGHNCSNCPAAADVAHSLHESNPSRIFIASIHSSPVGMSSFQAVNLSAGYTVDFTNTNSLGLGTFFGTYDGSFLGNPSGNVNRKIYFDGIFSASGSWGTRANEVLNSPLQVSIKSHANYYASTKGVFLHTEVDVLDASITNALGMVVYLIEDSLVAPQNVDGTRVDDYVHRDIMRMCISGQNFGRTLTDELKKDGKYYLDYSFVVPNQLAPQGQEGTHNASNMHLLIYVYNKSTYEIYQVIKQKIE